MSEKMKIERYILDDEYTFEIADSVDSSYKVWDIGEYMGRADLVPLCQMENAIYLNIRRDTLKAIRLPEREVRILCDAADYGVSSLQEAQEILKSKQRGCLQGIRKDLAKKSLPIFEKIYNEKKGDKQNV